MKSAFPYTAFEQAALQPGDLGGARALEFAHACLAHDRWDFLQQLVGLGFDLNATPRHEAVEETLLHRAIRIHLYEELADKIDHLLALGINPHSVSGQGLTPLGLLCTKARDMPAHRFIAAFEALERGGVSIKDPCRVRTEEGLERWLLESDDATKVIGKYCPDLLPWATSRKQQIELAEISAPAQGASSRPRL